MRRISIILMLLMLVVWPANAQNLSKIGVVDSEKLFDQYPGVQDATKKITDAQDELKNSITESEKVYGEFEKQKKSEAEKLTKRKELQSKIDSKALETKKLIESISVKVEDDILQSIKKIADEKGLTVVFDKRAVLLGGTDITDTVSAELKKKAPLAIENSGGEKVDTAKN